MICHISTKGMMIGEGYQLALSHQTILPYFVVHLDSQHDLRLLSPTMTVTCIIQVPISLGRKQGDSRCKFPFADLSREIPCAHWFV